MLPLVSPDFLFMLCLGIKLAVDIPVNSPRDQTLQCSEKLQKNRVTSSMSKVNVYDAIFRKKLNKYGFFGGINRIKPLLRSCLSCFLHHALIHKTLDLSKGCTLQPTQLHFKGTIYKHKVSCQFPKTTMSTLQSCSGNPFLFQSMRKLFKENELRF